MAQLIEIRLPDIGDFKDVPVIELLVKPGDTVEKETSLITLETDKATMEVPSPQAGVVNEIKVRIGDKISEGSLILTLETAGAAETAHSAEAAQPSKEPAQPGEPAEPARHAAEMAVPSAAPRNESGGSGAKPELPAAAGKLPVLPGDIHADVVVLGAGPG
ncbi:MAG: dihydrolipoyl dehydrogenase, partial [Betaproteobacteria bacterium]|nr:dihydrolipoyl dehydrogenase [Betaproteobacteria bacterium]